MSTTAGGGLGPGSSAGPLGGGTASAAGGTTAAPTTVPAGSGPPPSYISPYPSLAASTALPNSGAGSALAHGILRSATRSACPTWTPPPQGTKIKDYEALGYEKYSFWRKRFTLYAEGEIMLGVPHGLIARDLCLALGGEAGKLLLDIDRTVLYQNAATGVMSGLELCMNKLDFAYGKMST